MPYTAAQLSAYYQSLTGTAPAGADAVLINASAQQSQNGSQSDINTLLTVFNAANVQGTFEVAESTYQFFTGSGVSQAGLNFLEGNTGGGNANGLNSTYYTQFNTENRYYNFAINLASTGGAGNANFVSSYGNLTFAQTVSTAYESIVGSSNVGSANAQAAIADITSRQAFFTSVAQQRAGGVDAGGPAGQQTALKAVVIGYILEEANKADVGTYAKAIDQLEASVAAGNAQFGANILATYGASGSGFNSGFAALGANSSTQTNVSLTTGVDSISATTGNTNYIGTVTNQGTGANNVNPQTLQAGDQIRATGANNTLTITTVGAVTDASGGALINGVQTINVRPVAFTQPTPPSTTPGAATLSANAVQGATMLNAYVPQGSVTFNDVGSQGVGFVNDGTTTGGSLTVNYNASVATTTVNIAGGTTSGETVTLNGAGLATVNVNSNGGLNNLGTAAVAGGAAATSGLNLPGTVTTLNLAANSTLTIAGGINDTALTTLRASGSSPISAGTINATALTTLDTTGLTGTGALTATFTNAPAAGANFALGAGSDILTFNGGLVAGTNINLGQGQNSVIVTGNLAGTATATSSIIGGTQGDTVVVTGNVGAGSTINTSGGGDTIQVGTVTAGATVNGGGGAVFLTGQADFAAITTGAGFTAAQRGAITGFTTVGITDALQTATYDINAIGAQNFTTDGVAAGATATLNANTGATVTFANNVGINGAGGNLTANTGTLNVALANSAANANDILNLGYTGQAAGTVASNINLTGTTSTAGVAQGVETVNVTASGTATNATNVQLNLTDAALTNISFAGNESITYQAPAGSTVLRSINGAADTGTLTVDVSSIASTGATPVTVTTGSGNDNVFVRDFAQVTTGGTAGGGAANFNTVTVGVTTNGQSYSTVLDGKAGDHITFGATATAPATAPTAVNTTKIVLNNTTAVFQDYLDAATSASVANGTISGFDFQGNTYLVEQNGGGNNFQNGIDSVVKLVGIHTISTTSTGATGAILAS